MSMDMNRNSERDRVLWQEAKTKKMKKFRPDSEWNDSKALFTFKERWKNVDEELMQEWCEHGFTPTQAGRWVEDGYLTPQSAKAEISRTDALANAMRKSTTWETTDGFRCKNCGKTLTEHTHQLWCRGSGHAR